MQKFTGYTDLPIENLNDDKFNVGKYVEGLGKFILECDTPMTISIQGDWGSGKTSMMKMIQNSLGREILPVWFNTWQFSQFSLGNSLAISMIDVLLRELGGDTKILEKIADGTSNLLINATLTAIELTFGSRATGKIEKIFENYSTTNCVSEIKKLKENFEEAVEKKLHTKGEKYKRVVVFVDDLDRLEPAKAIELLEVLKIFLDCKNCVFILAVDYEIVTSGISQKYGDTIDAAKGKRFFEKIIQLPFKMPVAGYNIETYTRSMMEKMEIPKTLSNSSYIIKLFVTLIENSVGLNPRGMKRLFNTYRLLYNIMSRKNVKDDSLTHRTLFAAVCMQMSFESVYDYLSAGNIDAITLEKISEIDDKAVRRFLKRRSESSNIEVTDDDILEVLFNDKMPLDELSFQLQKFSTFIKSFIAAIHTEKDGRISDEELELLRNIVKNASITSVNPGNNSKTSDQVIERRQRNRGIVSEINSRLAENIGKFIMPQTNPGNTMSSEAIGYYIFNHSEKKYHFRYVLDSNENGNFSLSIYLNGMEQDPKKFYEFMGDNPLKYEKPPVMNVEPGWYFYDDIFEFDMNDKLAVGKIFGSVEESYRRLKKFLESKTKK